MLGNTTPHASHNDTECSQLQLLLDVSWIVFNVLFNLTFNLLPKKQEIQDTLLFISLDPLWSFFPEGYVGFGIGHGYQHLSGLDQDFFQRLDKFWEMKCVQSPWNLCKTPNHFTPLTRPERFDGQPVMSFWWKPEAPSSHRCDTTGPEPNVKRWDEFL